MTVPPSPEVARHAFEVAFARARRENDVDALMAALVEAGNAAVLLPGREAMVATERVAREGDALLRALRAPS